MLDGASCDERKSAGVASTSVLKKEGRAAERKQPSQECKQKGAGVFDSKILKCAERKNAAFS